MTVPIIPMPTTIPGMRPKLIADAGSSAGDGGRVPRTRAQSAVSEPTRRKALSTCRKSSQSYRSIAGDPTTPGGEHRASKVEDVQRCAWVPTDDPLYTAYHDEEWGVPIRDERALFELLNLEGAQAGLSWSTILRKRDGYRRAFAGWDVGAIARFDENDVQQLLANAGIVRHRGKIEAVIGNANAVLALDVPFSELLWSFVGGETRVNRWRAVAEIPAATTESTAMSKELKRRGFRFTGPTTCYAFMQSAGLVDDHELACFRRQTAPARRATT